METLYKIIGIALVTCIASIVVKPIRNDFAIIISVVGGIVVLFYVVSYISDVFAVFSQIFSVSGINTSIYSIIFKIIGIAYLIEFSASICNDTGNSSLGDKVMLGGKIIILVIALPIVTSIMDIIMGLLP